MSLVQAIVIAILQGATELFPVSSLGHAVILPALMHWTIDSHDQFFLPFLVMLHLGTLVALFMFFWRDWFAIAQGIFGRSDPDRQRQSVHIVALLIVAMVPAVLIGGVFEHKLRVMFGAATAACIFLILNGLMLLGCEWLRTNRRVDRDRPISAMTLGDALTIGFWQCLAFFPGISRSGATITGGLLRGLTHDVSARFSFLLAQPVIFAATVREVWELRHTPVSHEQLVLACVGAVVAGVTALFSTAFLMRYFRDHEKWALTPFGYYCIAAGAASLIFLYV